MEWIRDFRLALTRPLELMKKYRASPSAVLSIFLVGTACLMNAFAAPLAYQFFGRGRYLFSFSWGEGLIKLAAGAATFLLACLMFKLLAVLFSKPVGFKHIAATWGASFLPTLLCIAVVEASEAGFYTFIGNSWLGLLLCTFLILLLAWKAIYFFIELNVVLGLKGNQVTWAVLMTGVFYLILIMAGFRAGLKVPML